MLIFKIDKSDQLVSKVQMIEDELSKQKIEIDTLKNKFNDRVIVQVRLKIDGLAKN